MNRIEIDEEKIMCIHSHVYVELKYNFYSAFCNKKTYTIYV